INRFGFNSEGLASVARRLASHGKMSGPVGVNFGKNKVSEDAAADYAALAEGFANLADFFVVNVSSPNTPGLPGLQSLEPLRGIIQATRNARDKAATGTKPAIVLKIAPDMDADSLKDIVALSLAEKIDALAIGNTTVGRPDTLKSKDRAEPGG